MNITLERSDVAEKIGYCIDFAGYFMGFIHEISKSHLETISGLNKSFQSGREGISKYVIIVANYEFSLVKEEIENLYNDPLLSKINNEINYEALSLTDKQRVNDLINLIFTTADKVSNILTDYQVNKQTYNDNIKFKKRKDELESENLALTTRIRKLEGESANKLVTNIYQGVENENKKSFLRYRNLFIGSILLTVFIAVSYNPLISVVANIIELWEAIFYLDYKHSITEGNSLTLNLNTLKYFVFKLSVIVVGATLSTYFLRLSSFYQSKYEQAKQTRLELEAFPDYASLLKVETAEELRKDLALKYFGKDIDKNMIEKNGDLVLEQTRVSTELVKASLDVVKANQPSKS
ncbi:hypothetical protein [Acinetobacter courvalinii]|uniref:hypothetical protein n=1 Tax=Acinetobacter courvalinii TaxID=280147 RepID=UPI001D0E8B72|nr:hypothetical protein [Acinetobacter courvalinii]